MSGHPILPSDPITLPLLPLRLALMALWPLATALARPCVPMALETVATAVSALAQVAAVVRSWVLPSEIGRAHV